MSYRSYSESYALNPENFNLTINGTRHLFLNSHAKQTKELHYIETSDVSKIRKKVKNFYVHQQYIWKYHCLDECIRIEHYIAAKGTLEALHCFTESGKINPDNINSGTPKLNRRPLHFAVWYLNNQLLQALIDRGANPNAVDSNGKTALHIACERGNVSAIKILISQTDNNIKDKNGMTAKQLAEQNGKHSIVNLFEERALENSYKTTVTILHTKQEQIFDMVQENRNRIEQLEIQLGKRWRSELSVFSHDSGMGGSVSEHPINHKHKLQKDLMHKHFDTLCHNMDSHKTTVGLFQRQVFEIKHKQIIRGLPTEYQRNEYIIEFVLQNLDDRYPKFIEVLQATHQAVVQYVMT